MSNDARFQQHRQTAVLAGLDEVQASKSPLESLLESSFNCLPTVLYGPPGTGKTRCIELAVKSLKEQNRLGRFELVQFHRRFSYEDFIEGYVPTRTGFKRKDGIFKDFCKTASDKERIDVFVIDEMNRADLASTLGEVLYALEDRNTRKVRTAHFGEEFTIPTNLFLVGTMNTADRSIAQVDFAIRRRFRFVPVFPDYIELQTWISSYKWNIEEFQILDYIDFAKRTNQRIAKSKNLGSHMQLGQSLFVPKFSSGGVKTPDLLRNFVESVLGQVEAYVGLGNEDQLADLFGRSVAERFVSTRAVSNAEFVGLVLESVNDET